MALDLIVLLLIAFFLFFLHVLFRESCFFVAFKFAHTVDVSVSHWHMLSFLFHL